MGLLKNFDEAYLSLFSKIHMLMKKKHVTTDNEFRFDNYVLNIYSKANQKLSALLRMKNFLSLEKKCVLFKAFIESQFEYCPLSWIFHIRKANIKITHIHERALRMVYKGKKRVRFVSIKDIFSPLQLNSSRSKIICQILSYNV